MKLNRCPINTSTFNSIFNSVHNFTFNSNLSSNYSFLYSSLFLILCLSACSTFNNTNSNDKTTNADNNQTTTQIQNQETNTTNNPSEIPDYDNSQIPVLDTSKNLQIFSYGSCAIQDKPQPIWNTILNKQPQLYLGLGDNIYASSPKDKPIPRAYKRQMQFPEFIQFRKQVPMLGVYDDHDYGVNDGGKENPEKDLAKSEYLKFFPLDNAFIASSQQGIYHEVTLGKAPRRIQFIFLDTRWFRDSLEKNPEAITNPNTNIKFIPTKDTEKTVLGLDQWKWLEDSINKPAELKVIISSIQLLPTEQGFEKWENFPHERKRLIQLLEKSKNKNYIVLSGDRHLGEISRIKTQTGSITEVTASSINRGMKPFQEKNSLRLTDQPYFQENFGLGIIDWKRKEIKLQLVDLSGSVISETSVLF